MLERTFYVDVQRKILLDENQTRVSTGNFRLTQGDTDLLRFRFVQWDADNSEWDAYEPPDAASWQIGIKLASAFDGNYLAEAGDASWDVAGDWTELGTDGSHCVRLECASSDLDSALATDDLYVDAKIEIEVTDTAGRTSTLLHADVRILNDVITGTESVGAAAAQYYTQEQARALFMPLAGDQQAYKVVNDHLCFYFPDDGSWRYLVCRIVEGTPTHSWSDAT
jgi:hypothetical protein